MKRRDLILIENYFKEYYYHNTKLIMENIPLLEDREFAYIDFDNVMRRHISFRIKEFKEWLLENVPKHFYHSSSYYMFPEKEMDSKGWKGADLVFDIDLDHISSYKPEKVILCKDKGDIITKDEDECNDKKEIVILNNEGLLAAKKELLNLLEILSRDFDIKIDDMQIFFSGARGYHVHIRNSKFLKLDSYARMEIKDYLTFDGIDIRYINTEKSRPLRKFFNAVLSSNEKLKNVFTDSEIEFLKKISRKKELSLFLKEIKKRKIIAEKVNRFIPKFLGVQIDGVVTVDVSRLIRTPYSLHGKTGLIKTPVPYNDLDSFNPFVDSVRKDEEKIKLKILYCPKIYWYDNDYGPYFNEEKTIPFSLGIYLSTNGLAYEIRKY